jgi:hypothetical protein
MTGMEWAMVGQKDWAHGIQVQHGDALVCVWYVHLCCESVGDSLSMGTQWLAAETQEVLSVKL